MTHRMVHIIINGITFPFNLYTMNVCDIYSNLCFSSANYILYNYHSMPMGHEQFYVLSRCNQFSALLLVQLHTVLTKSPLGDRYGFYFYLGKEEKPHLGGNTITADQWQTIFIKMDQNTR